MKPKPRRLIEAEDLPLFAQYQGVTPLAEVLPVHCPRCGLLLGTEDELKRGTLDYAAHECITEPGAAQLDLDIDAPHLLIERC